MRGLQFRELPTLMSQSDINTSTVRQRNIILISKHDMKSLSINSILIMGIDTVCALLLARAHLYALSLASMSSKAVSSCLFRLFFAA